VGGLLVVAALVYLATRPSGPTTTAQGNTSSKGPTSVDPPLVTPKKTSETGGKTEVGKKTEPVPSKTTAKTDLKTDDEPKTKPHDDPGPGPKTKKKEPPKKSAESDVTDLLSLVDPARDVSAGQWTLEKRVLRGESGQSNGAHALLKVPFNCPREYD